MSATVDYRYQDADVESLLSAMRRVRRVLYCLPTGGGKSYVACKLMQRLRVGSTALILAHRRELLTQMRKAMVAMGVAGADRRIVLLSPLRASRLSAAALAKFDLVIVDEAHRAGGATYHNLLARMPDARVLGLTASPYRREGLRGEFDEMVTGPDVGALVEAGVILAPSYWSVGEEGEADLSDVAIDHGEYSAAQLERAMNKPHLVGHIVREWLARAEGCSTLVFAAGLKHAASIAEQFVAAGVDARVVTGKTGESERDALLRDFDTGAFPVLVNALLLVEGIDVHRIDCLVMARATRSRVLFVQMVGRAMRPSPTGRVPLIHDHASAWRWHGLPTTPREWSLDGAARGEWRTGTPAAKRCAECGMVAARQAMDCGACGASFRRVDEEQRLREVRPPATNCSGCAAPLSMGRHAVWHRAKTGTTLCLKCANAARRKPGYVEPKPNCELCGVALGESRSTTARRARIGRSWCRSCAAAARAIQCVDCNASVPVSDHGGKVPTRCKRCGRLEASRKYRHADPDRFREMVKRSREKRRAAELGVMGRAAPGAPRPVGGG